MKQRKIQDHWQTTYEMQQLPGVQKGMILPPEKMQVHDPFLLMAEDWFKRGAFSDHPHRGFQTITYVIDGRLEHTDNSGGHSVLDAGDMQYMNAGKGARHAEEAVDDDLIHTLQLWLNLPKEDKMTESYYQNVRVEDAPVKEIEGGTLRVYSGEIDGIKGSAESVYPFRMAEVQLEEGAEYDIPFPGEETVFSFVLAGEVLLGEEEVKQSRAGTAVYEKEPGASAVRIKAASRARILFYSGKPIQEPIAAGGPFVMNTEDEVRQAMKDYHAGRFGPSSQ
ncbi:pirin family protein [Alkalicoccus urumqiensis]|uniref:Pirin family protein n=1 Tax=Alkalicoccus urumqiensis TaxID=1548213 RepID=A0A2P6MGQ3_ALKUR|nr:pirin-like C-terminal cupin domain-containing protein [Alkalicoccus urumqiensis]PRO65466.1 pirin family protein [Alkalicoccus urumqiensis]